jgi:hypothetical protein
MKPSAEEIVASLVVARIEERGKVIEMLQQMMRVRETLAVVVVVVMHLNLNNVIWHNLLKHKGP